MRLLDGESRTTIGAALVRAQKEQDKRFFLRSVSFSVGEDEVQVDVTVRSLTDAANPKSLWFVEFGSPAKREEPRIEEVQFSRSGEDYFAIESELAYTKESLSATIEELETSNEELQSTNEELIASNEELQSTNEELHSVNEELYSVNAENHRKITELHEISEDMDNLLCSTDVGTVFMDVELRIRKFTKAATEYFNLVGHDIGRPLTNFTHSLKLANLPDLIEQVIESGDVYMAEVENKTGQLVLLKILPYISGTDRAGAILNLVNLQEIRNRSD